MQAMMKLSRATVQLMATCAVAFAGAAAMAQEVTEIDTFVSTKTRAEVKAELAKARAEGTLVRSEESSYPDWPASSVRSREAVRAEAREEARTRSHASLYIGG